MHPIARDLTDKPTLYLTVVIAKGVVAHRRHWTTSFFADTDSGRVLGRGTVRGILDTKTSEVIAHQAGREHWALQQVPFTNFRRASNVSNEYYASKNEHCKRVEDVKHAFHVSVVVKAVTAL